MACISTLDSLAALAALLALSPCPPLAQQASDAVAPEAPQRRRGQGRRSRPSSHMVVAANPLAAQAGLDVLRAGGNAADALVAVQTVLGLVEPQSSGLGGGAFLVWYDAASGTVTTFDGRETAPAAATPDLFLGADGKPLGFFDAVVGGRSVGVPGVPRLLETVHARYGTLRLGRRCCSRRSTLAENGFAVSPRLDALIAEDAGRLDSQPAPRAYFFDAAGAPLPAGHDPAQSGLCRRRCRRIAAGGADAFYTGPIADGIVAAVQRPRRPIPAR